MSQERPSVHRVPEVERKVELRVPKVGQGNPATLFAIKRELLAAGIFSHTTLLDVSAAPVRLFHSNMTASSEHSADYTKNSEQERKGMKATIFGVVARVEIELSKLLHHRGEDPEILIAVQEHPFAAYSKEELKEQFPKGVYLYIPDVYPKQSAITMMQEKDIIPLVWNTDAQKELQKLGLHPILVAPVLPLSYHHDGQRGLERMKEKGVEDYVVIKASGSGLAQQYLDAVVPVLKSMGVRYEIWYGDHMESADVVKPVQGSYEDQTSSFYAHILAHPPKVLIGYPSEMVQVAATLRQIGTQYLTFPPRGSHEKRNLQFARSHSRRISTGKLKIEDPINLRRTIVTAWNDPALSVNPDFVGLGTASIVDVIKEKLQ